MSNAEFSVGQVVVFNRGNDDGHITGAEFTVLRVMPLEDKQRSYRVRGQDGVERVLEGTRLVARAATSKSGEAWPVLTNKDQRSRVSQLVRK